MRYPMCEVKLDHYEHNLVTEVLASNRITQGPMVGRFEHDLEQLLNVPYVVACSSGTTALHLALAALGIGPGDEVLVPNLSFVATANAVKYVGATPVLCDVNPMHWDIDPRDEQVTEHTRAMIVVHLYGRPARMQAHKEFAHRHGLCLIEDAAQGFGASYCDEPLGTLSDMGTFSFYGNKIITTGEGGAVVTRNPHMDSRLRNLRGQAQRKAGEYYHYEVGFNYRMTEMQAAIGVGQLAKFGYLMARRRVVCDQYYSILHRQFDCTLPSDAPWAFTVVLPANRDDIAIALRERGIETRPGFVPMSELPMYRQPGLFPWSRRLADSAISLPTHPHLLPEDVRDIAHTFLEVANGN